MELKNEEDRNSKKEKNQHGRQKKGIPKTIIAKINPWMAALQQLYKTTSPDKSKKSECSRRDVPKIKMDLRGNLMVDHAGKFVAELVVDEELSK